MSETRLNPQQAVDFIEESISHTFLEPTAHGLLVCMQEAISGYWHWLAMTEAGDGLKPQQSRHKDFCGPMYTAMEDVVARAYERKENSLPRTYECPVCHDEDPAEPSEGTPVNWDED